MPRYAVLPAPSANRVYAAAALGLAEVELAFLDRYAFGGLLEGIAVEQRGGVPYLGFGSGEPLADEEVRAVGALSSAHAVFEVEGGAAGELLRPVRAGGALHRFDDDLLTIPRYAGRTNEQFTALLVTLATVAGHGMAALGSTRLRVLDPVCGRGTTVNQAVMCGHDAAGVDLDGRDVEAWATFFATWLKDKRLKHQVERHHLRRSTATGGGVRIEVSLWEDKAAQHAGDGQKVVMIADDTRTTAAHLGARSVDAIAADLPYGVAHGSRSGDRLARRPGDLVAEALPVWRDVLRPGAAMALAWNVRTMPLEAMAEAVAEAGLEQVEVPGSFLHRVDRTITRDVMIARRPKDRPGG